MKRAIQLRNNRCRGYLVKNRASWALLVSKSGLWRSGWLKQIIFYLKLQDVEWTTSQRTAYTRPSICHLHCESLWCPLRCFASQKARQDRQSKEGWEWFVVCRTNDSSDTLSNNGNASKCFTIQSCKSLTSVTVYTIPPSLNTYAYSARSCVVIIRALCLRFLKCGSGKRKKSFESCTRIQTQSISIHPSFCRTNLSFFKEIRHELHGICTNDGHVVEWGAVDGIGIVVVGAEGENPLMYIIRHLNTYFHAQHEHIGEERWQRNQQTTIPTPDISKLHFPRVIWFEQKMLGPIHWLRIGWTEWDQEYEESLLV